MMKRVVAVLCAVIMLCSFGGLTASANKWVGNDTNGWKYQYDDGTYAAKGWLKSGGNKYYIQSDGTRKTGWMETTSGNKYFFNNKGVMATGLWRIGEDRYYFTDDGVMVTGVLQKGNKTYYFYEDGRLYKIETVKKRKKIVTETSTYVVTEYVNPDGTTYERESKPTVTTDVTYVD